MTMRDIHNEIEARVAKGVVRQTDADTAIVSNIIDTANYNSLEFLIITGDLTDTNVVIATTLHHGDDASLTDAAVVPAAERAGDLPAFVAGDDNVVKKVGYVGGKRYVRLTLTPTGNDSGNVDVAVVALLAGARKQPTP